MKRVFILLSTVVFAFAVQGCGGTTTENDVMTDAVALDIVADAGSDTSVIEDTAVDAERDEGMTDQGFEDMVGPDAGQDVLDPDAGEDILNHDVDEDVVVPCPGNLGCACEDNQECYSGYCVETSGGKVCTKNCAGGNDCPRGWECSQVVVSGDSTFICIDPYARACRPCVEDSDCVPSFGASQSAVYDCIPYGPEGSYCGGSCDSDEDCSEGYECVALHGRGRNM